MGAGSIRTAALSAAKLKRFEFWLAHNGAEVLAPTNPYEVLRFKAGDGTGVIYSGAKSGWTVVNAAIEPLQAFLAGMPWKAPLITVKAVIGTRYYAALVKRDGPECFYCGKEVEPQESSLEHLVPRSLGGPNHMANFALAHQKCNSDAGNLSAVEKVKLRDSMRAA